MRVLTMTFMIMSLCFFAVPSYGADVAKIGVIDFQKILSTSSAGKMATEEINRRGQEMEADLKKRGESIDAIKKKFEREALVLSQEKRDEKEREIRISINDFKTLQKKYMADFKEHEKRLVDRIQKEVLEIVTEMGKKEGFLLILEKRGAGILYSPDTIDITDRLIQKYNAKFAQNAEKKDTAEKGKKTTQ